MEGVLSPQGVMHLALIGFSSVLSLFILFFAYRLGFFTRHLALAPLVPWKETFKIFLLFMTFQFLIFPFIASFWMAARDPTEPISPMTQGLWNIALVASIAGAVALWSWMKSSIVAPMFRSQHLFRDLNLGAAAWFIVYPIVLLFSQIILFVLVELWELSLVDQLAVQQVKEVLKHPSLLSATLFSVVGIVPVLEELLFRGFLQGSFKVFLKPIWAIVATSLIFSFFHFAIGQGANNATILSSLFILSLFLGYLKERQGSLWAPIGLHITFNAISVSMILASCFDFFNF